MFFFRRKAACSLYFREISGTFVNEKKYGIMLKRRGIDILLFAVVLMFAVSMVNRSRDMGDSAKKSTSTVENSEPSSQTSGLTITEYMLTVKGAKDAMLLRRLGYTAGYSKEWRCPVWVAWELTEPHTTGEYSRKGVSYHEDYDVPAPRATNADYSRSGYDRGHMCPSGDNKWSSRAQEECFLFTNMCPQSHNLNGGDWNDLEMKCRTWAKRYGYIYIICGPVFKGDRPSRTIGRNKVWVPDGFYKVVMRTGGDDECAAIGFYYDNEDGHRPMSEYVCTVDEIEEMTGLDFFSGLNDKTESRIEAAASLREW